MGWLSRRLSEMLDGLSTFSVIGAAMDIHDDDPDVAVVDDRVLGCIELLDWWMMMRRHPERWRVEIVD